MNIIFDRSKHVFHSDAFAEIIKDTIRFFNGTPIQYLPPQENFLGTGVYALYYIGKSKYYQPLYDLNRTGYNQPIYVGKADDLLSRLCNHHSHISTAKNLKPIDFMCRYMTFDENDHVDADMFYNAMIDYYNPAWNCCINGFGDNDASSDWNVLHGKEKNKDENSFRNARTKEVYERLRSFFINSETIKMCI